jgi:tRNA (guanine-N7-)-methyltransferase
MPFVNPYIEKIKDNIHIIEEKERAIQQKGAWQQYFKNTFPICLEIGTGLGNFFAYQVWLQPNTNFIGMEIKFKRVYKTYEKAIKAWGNNFVVLKRYAQEINEIFWDEEIDTTYILFPDPWNNKDRQKKNKLLQKDFIETLYKKTKRWGKWIFKTDHREYFEETLKIIEELKMWNIKKVSSDYEKEIEEFNKKMITEFEWLFRGENKKICYLECERS